MCSKLLCCQVVGIQRKASNADSGPLIKFSLDSITLPFQADMCVVYANLLVTIGKFSLKAHERLSSPFSSYILSRTNAIVQANYTVMKSRASVVRLKAVPFAGEA